MASRPPRSTAEGQTNVTVRDEQTKRLHLNVMMQGAAVDASSCLHPTPELDALHPDFSMLNRRIGVAMQLSQFETRSFLLAGRSGGNARRFWSSTTRASHPFADSRLLRQHGRALADQSYEDGAERAAKIGITKKTSTTHDRQLLENIKTLHTLETPLRAKVANLAADLSAREWEIPTKRLSATLQARNLPGRMLAGQQAPRNPRERLNAACAAGWSQLTFSGGAPRIEAAALVFILLRHELVKGIAELCCSHGLAQLDDSTYGEIIAASDKIALERPGMQVGPALYRRWVASLPGSVSPAIGLTHLSLAEPDIVESTLVAVVEDQLAAREIMAHLCRDSIIELE